MIKKIVTIFDSVLSEPHYDSLTDVGTKNNN